jgi:hypothetical protein
MSAKKKPWHELSAAEKIRLINETNRKYAEGMAGPFERRAMKNPSLLSTEAGFERLQAEAMAVYEERSAEAASSAKKRGPKKPTYRSVIIAEMRIWHHRGDSFKEFLRSAEGGLDGFSIMPPTKKRDADKFIIECDVANEPQKPISLSTLRGWWAEAR